MNKGAAGRGQGMANLQLFQLAPFQYLELKGEGVRLQVVQGNSRRVESGGVCQKHKKIQRRHPHSYFVKQIVRH